MSELNGKELNVIYVDDDENDVTLLRYALRKAGVELAMQHLPDGLVAVEYLRGAGKYRNREKYPLPNLLLLDIKMPGMGGLDVLKWVRAQRELSGVVVIMFSTSDEESDVRRAYERGANSYVVKSVDLEEGARMARAFQAWWIELNCCPPCPRVPREHPPRTAKRTTALLGDNKMVGGSTIVGDGERPKKTEARSQVSGRS